MSLMQVISDKISLWWLQSRILKIEFLLKYQEGQFSVTTALSSFGEKHFYEIQ